MKKSQSGFTLIELVVVIVLLGILGVTALGKFQNLSADASGAAVQGVASELAASSAINFAEGILDATYTVPLTAANVCTTLLLQPLLASNTWPSADITVTATGNCTAIPTGAGPGGAVNCTLTHAKGGTAIASIVCSG